MNSSANIIAFCLLLSWILVSNIGDILALRQLAGPINIKIEPGTSKSFIWKLLSDSNNASLLNISATGNASSYLFFPKVIKLEPKSFADVPVQVSIPANFKTNTNLTSANLTSTGTNLTSANLTSTGTNLTSANLTSTGTNLTSVLRAIEPGLKGGSTVINLEMSKNVTISVSNATSRTPT